MVLKTNEKTSLAAPQHLLHAEHSLADSELQSLLTTMLMGLALPLLPAVLCCTD